MMRYSANNNKCCLCGNTQPKQVLWSDGSLSAVECEQCTLIYAWPLPSSEEINKLYPKEYYQSYIDDITNRSSYTRNHFHKMQPQLNKPGRLLDLGCGIGYFADFVRRRGWEVSGIEPSGWAATYAQDCFQLNIFNGSLVKAHFPEKTFDLITLWDVLSHLENPLDTLKEINRILKNGGLILLRVPIRYAFSFRFAQAMSCFIRNSQSIIHFPYQIYHFNTMSLKLLLFQSGFQEATTSITRDLYIPSKESIINWKNYLIKLLELASNGFKSRNTMLVLGKKV